MSVVPAYVCAFHVYLVPGRSEEGTAPLELELGMIVSHCVGAGNGTQVLCKSNKALISGPSL